MEVAAVRATVGAGVIVFTTAMEVVVFTRGGVVVVLTLVAWGFVVRLLVALGRLVDLVDIVVVAAA